MSGAPHVLEVSDLRVHFRGDDVVIHAVNGVSFAVREGESLAIVGESGSGKSVTNMAVLRLIPQPPGEMPTGEIRYRGRDVLKMTAREVRAVRGGKISMIFQDPMTSLNPFLRISRQLTETIELHLGLRGEAARARAIEMLDKVGIPDPAARIDSYPHEFSGGMRQRVMIAMALSTDPDLLIADEPTTALDVTIQAQILDLIRRLQRERGMSLILITHDLAVVAGMCDRVAVMYGGKVVETASVDELFADPRHPYTLALLRSVPRLDETKGHRLEPIEGLPPKLHAEPASCSFAPRCRFVEERCRREVPALEPDDDGRLRACFVPIRRGKRLAEALADEQAAAAAREELGHAEPGSDEAPEGADDAASESSAELPPQGPVPGVTPETAAAEQGPPVEPGVHEGEGDPAPSEAVQEGVHLAQSDVQVRDGVHPGQSGEHVAPGVHEPDTEVELDPEEDA